ncbi:MAG: putative membrane protein [Cenarchaeum symbiont of Oopsacas minuta]|nr:putative membrane protein [Cenarchaeum symbiont of Oopsacas minuta]
MNDIRVNYVGIIAFISNIVLAVGGTIFSIMIIRLLPPDDFGFWILISSLITYVLILDPIPSYWLVRRISRGDKLAKTGLFTSTGLSGIGVIVYVGLIFIVYVTLNVDLIILIVAVLLIPTGFLKNSIASVCLGCKPQAISYSVITSILVKLIVGIVLVFGLKLGLLGLLIAVIIENIAGIISMFMLTRSQNVMGVLDYKFIRFVFSMSWLSIFTNAPYIIRNLDVLIFPILTGSLVGAAYWGIGLTLSRFIIYSGSISHGVYTKILATNDIAPAINNLRYMLFVAIPILSLIISLSKPALYVLNPLYVHISLPVILYSFNAMAFLLLMFFVNVLNGKDEVDINNTTSFKKYVNSDLFHTSTILTIYSISYVVTFTVLLYLKIFGESDLELVIGWAMTSFIFTAFFTIIIFILLKQKYDFTFPYISIIKYILSAILIIIITNYITEYLFTYSGTVYNLIPQLLSIIAIGFSIYLLISIVIDKPCRELIQSCFREIAKMKKFK